MIRVANEGVDHRRISESISAAWERRKTGL